MILGPGDVPPATVFVIRQGTVRGERPRGAAEVAARGCSSSTPAKCSRWRATRRAAGRPPIVRPADTFCVEVPAADFDALLARSPPFHEFCTRKLAYLLDLVRAEVQAEYASNLTDPARHGRRRSPRPPARGAAVTVAPETTLLDAPADHGRAPGDRLRCR